MCFKLLFEGVCAGCVIFVNMAIVIVCIIFHSVCYICCCDLQFCIQAEKRISPIQISIYNTCTEVVQWIGEVCSCSCSWSCVISDQLYCLCAGVQPEQHLQSGLWEDPAAQLQARHSHDAPGAITLLAV